MAWDHRIVWLVLHIYLWLPVLGSRGLIGSDKALPLPICGMQPTHICQITTYDIGNIALSNYTVSGCADVVNLTRGVTTKIVCLLAAVHSTTGDLYYKWRMEAPPGSKVLVTVPGYDVASVIRASDEDRSGNIYTFAANSFVSQGDFFLSSSNVVYMEAKFTLVASPKNFTIIGQALDVITLPSVSSESSTCNISSPHYDMSHVNQWKTVCGNNMHTFENSCYQFNNRNHGNRGEESKSTAGVKCEEIGHHLVYIESSEEHKFLASTALNITMGQNCMMGSGAQCDFWIGIKRNPSNELVWMDGSPITYNITESMDMESTCFQLKHPGYRWEANRNCQRHLGYICERELGYLGNISSHEGCITFRGRLTSSTESEGAVLLKFTYYIKTIGGTDRSRVSYRNGTIWTGNYVFECLPNNGQSLNRNGLQVNVSCFASLPASDAWMVTFQARGTGLVQISNLQLIIYDGIVPPTTRPMPSSTIVPFTSPSGSKQQSTSTTTTFVVSEQSSSFSPDTTSQSSSLFMSTMGEKFPSPTSHPNTTYRSTPSITTEYYLPQDEGVSSGSDTAVVAAVVVLLIVLIIALIAGVVWHKMRGKSPASEKKPQCPENNFLNPTYENDNGEQHEYADFQNSEIDAFKAVIPVTSSEDVQQHEYTELPSSALHTKKSSVVIYNEVGEQDYNVLFGGKEKSDYHEYNLPDSGQGKIKAPTDNGSYQEQLQDRQNNVKCPGEAGHNSYQDLRKDEDGYTSLDHCAGIPTKPERKVTAPEIENCYQALQPEGPEYFTLEPDETKKSENPKNTNTLQGNTYQSLRPDQNSENAVLKSDQRGISLSPKNSEDSTYQSLIKDVNNLGGSDIGHSKDSTPKNDTSDPYDVLQRNIKPSKPFSSDGYGSLGQVAKAEIELDYETPNIGPNMTSDYEDPIQIIKGADEPYDNLQRKTMPHRPRPRPSRANQSADGDVDDYETPDRPSNDSTDTHQTLDDRQEKNDIDNEEYSYLQRPLGTKPSRYLTGSPLTENQYGKLILASESGN